MDGDTDNVLSKEYGEPSQHEAYENERDEDNSLIPHTIKHSQEQENNGNNEIIRSFEKKNQEGDQEGVVRNLTGHEITAQQQESNGEKETLLENDESHHTPQRKNVEVQHGEMVLNMKPSEASPLVTGDPQNVDTVTNAEIVEGNGAVSLNVLSSAWARNNVVSLEQMERTQFPTGSKP